MFNHAINVGILTTRAPAKVRVTVFYNKHNLLVISRYAERTGGGPALPELMPEDGDTIETSNELGIPGQVPHRDSATALTYPDGRTVRYVRFNYFVGFFYLLPFCK